MKHTGNCFKDYCIKCSDINSEYHEKYYDKYFNTKENNCEHGFRKDFGCGYCSHKQLGGNDYFAWDKYPNGLPGWHK